MVSFSNMDGAHCDSVVDHYTLPSNSIQMDVKVPVQPSNFDPLQKGALMGASTFMEQDKNHSNQCNYKTKSIPSPGTTYSENPPKRRVFAFPGVGLSIELRSIIRRQRLTPSGPARQARCSTPAALVRVRAPLIQRTRPKGGFLLFRGQTLHRTMFDYSPPAAHPFGASAPGMPLVALPNIAALPPVIKLPYCRE